MQVKENLSRIEGPVVARRQADGQPGWDDVTVRLDSADAVDDRAELLQPQLGTEIVIGVPHELLGDAKPGDIVEGHVSVAGPGRILAAPQSVEGGRFVVVPADA